MQLREGTAEDTGCTDASVDAVISVNNVMLWDRGAGFDELVQEASEAGLVDVTVGVHWRQHGMKVELLARRAPRTDVRLQQFAVPPQPAR